MTRLSYLSNRRARQGWRGWFCTFGFCLLVLAWVLLVGLAIRFQFDGVARWGWLGVVAFVTILTLWLRLSGKFRSAWLVLWLWLALAALWWGTIQPTDARDWAPDVAHGVTAEFEGDAVVLHNVRAFDWRTSESFTERWETRRYDLDDLVTVDLLTSVWSSPAIAHTLISFGFANGDQITFSAEIRKERHEAFSELGGFFKRFELVMIAADERDIVYLRTNVRREDVSLFPLQVSPAQGRALFLRYLEMANDLAERPAFYHTVIANCTTIVFDLARLVAPVFPADWRILMSGYLPEYLHELGIVAPDLSVPELRRRASISETAQQWEEGQRFSELIRKNWRAP